MRKLARGSFRPIIRISFILLCISACAEGLSFYRVTRIMHLSTSSTTACFAFDGTMHFIDSRGPGMKGWLAGRNIPGRHWIFEFEPVPRQLGRIRWGLAIRPQVATSRVVPKSGPIIQHHVFIPLWMLIVLFAILPAVSIMSRLRRRNPYACVQCGYDLRASTERCPECGKAIEVMR